MYIDITIKVGDFEQDVSIDNRQIICVAMKIINKKIPIIFPMYFRSEIQRRIISSWFTFEEEGIVDGDCLVGIETEMLGNDY